MARTILKPDKSYAFADYFELNYPTEEIVAEFSYHYELTRLTLPMAKIDADLNHLKQTFYKDIEAFRVLVDLEALCSVLVGILQPPVISETAV